MVENQSPEPLRLILLDIVSDNDGSQYQSFLKKRALDYLVYSWVCCAKNMLPSATIQEAVRSCLRYYNIQPGELSQEAAERSYYRLQEQWRLFYKKSSKSNKT